MRPDVVLVLGSEENGALREGLFESGLTAIVRQTMQSALERLRGRGLAGIIVDSRNVACDVLEFVLNVRDFDPDIPVFVLDDGSGSRDEQVLLRDAATFLARDVTEVCAVIEESLAAGEPQIEPRGATQ